MIQISQKRIIWELFENHYESQEKWFAKAGDFPVFPPCYQLDKSDFQAGRGRKKWVQRHRRKEQHPARKTNFKNLIL